MGYAGSPDGQPVEPETEPERRTVMAPDMQARRDAFLMLTDEKPPAEPDRWLVVWDEVEHDGWKWTNWRSFNAHAPAEAFAAALMEHAQIHDLDYQ